MLNKTEIEILDKGLGFVPNIQTINLDTTEIIKKIDRLINKTIKLHTGIKQKPTHTYTLTQEIIKEIEKEHQNTQERNTNNLTIQEEKNLKKLTQREEVIIKPIDKNLGVAAIEKEFYIKEIEKMLNDTNSYKKLKENPITATTKKITTLIRNLYQEKKINKKQMNKILPAKETRTGRFYGLPKIHKPKLSWRPIVSNNQHPTENLSKWISTILNPTSKKTQSHLENSYELCEIIKKINKEKEEKEKWSILTADIENLYTNIPHREGTNACIKALYNDDKNQLKLKDTNAMKALINNALCNNIFEFNDQHFTQINGTAMGTSMAPAYANIYLAEKEKEWLKKKEKEKTIILFKRYLDDILIIHNITKEQEIQELQKELENIYLPLKLNIETGKKLPFLDLELEVNELNQIQYNLYKKPLNSKEIIPYNSCHSDACKQGTIIGEYKRIKALNSKSITRKKEEIKLLDKCLKQNYPYKDIIKAKKKAMKEKRTDNEQDKTYITLTYNYQTKYIEEKIKEMILKAKRKQENKEKRKIPNIKIIIAKRTQPNLKKILTRAKIKIKRKMRRQLPIPNNRRRQDRNNISS
jgi:hypothetical protein